MGVQPEPPHRVHIGIMLCCHCLEFASTGEQIRPGPEKPQPTEPDMLLQSWQSKNGFYLWKSHKIK